MTARRWFVLLGAILSLGADKETQPHVFQLRLVCYEGYGTNTQPATATAMELHNCESLELTRVDGASHMRRPNVCWVSREAQIDERDLSEVRAELSKPQMTQAQLESLKQQHPDLYSNVQKQTVNLDKVLTGSEPQLSFLFSQQGTGKLARLTNDNTRKILAIVIDGKVLITAKIDRPITNGVLQLNGPYLSMEMRDRLASELNQAIQSRK